METVQCRVCGIQNWLECGCYYLTGGMGTLGDMNTEFKFIHCPECDGMGYHEPRCSGYKEICGYFVQCENYQQNLTCEHKDAPVYERKQA